VIDIENTNIKNNTKSQAKLHNHYKAACRGGVNDSNGKDVGRELHENIIRRNAYHLNPAL